MPFQAVASAASSKQWAAVTVYSRRVLGSRRPYPREQADHRSDPPSLTRIIARPPADQGARSSIRPNGRDGPSITTRTGMPPPALSSAAAARTSIGCPSAPTPTRSPEPSGGIATLVISTPADSPNGEPGASLSAARDSSAWSWSASSWTTIRWSPPTSSATAGGGAPTQ
jgi:hypothetical protein